MNRVDVDKYLYMLETVEDDKDLDIILLELLTRLIDEVNILDAFLNSLDIEEELLDDFVRDNFHTDRVLH